MGTLVTRRDCTQSMTEVKWHKTPRIPPGVELQEKIGKIVTRMPHLPYLSHHGSSVARCQTEYLVESCLGLR